MRGLVALLAAVLAVLGAAGAAAAHTRSETHSSWIVSGASVRLAVTVPDLEAARLAPSGVRTSSQLGAYLDPRVGVSAGGRACPRTHGPTAVAAESGYQRFEFVFECGAARPDTVTDRAYFDRVPTHVNFAQIRTEDGRFIEQLITAEHPSLSLTEGRGDSPLRDAGFVDYVRLGILHIFTGVDHQLFLLGLILLSRRLKDLLFVITGFTIGHSITLALAVTGVVRPHAEFIDALIGFTIALVGAEGVAETSGRPGWVSAAILSLLLLMAAAQGIGWRSMPVELLIGAGLFGANYVLIAGHLRDAARLRLAVTLVFGLIHGFGFAADLLEMRLPTDRLAELLVGFNLGVELGQIALVSTVAGIGLLLAQGPLARFRPLAGDAAAGLLVGIGLFWFVSRGFAAGGGGHLG